MGKLAPKPVFGAVKWLPNTVSEPFLCTRVHCEWEIVAPGSGSEFFFRSPDVWGTFFFFSISKSFMVNSVRGMGEGVLKIAGMGYGNNGHLES